MRLRRRRRLGLGLGLGARVPSDRAPGGGASSVHLWWQGLDRALPVVSASVTLEVLQAPVVSEVYFWALQATFHDGARAHGVAHLGLQWNPRHPGSTAVNWGGYADGADVRSVLSGTPSELPSEPADPNTRDYPWLVGEAHRLCIERGSSGWWGSVTGPDDVRRPVRQLLAGGDRLVDLVVWTEMFAGCQEPETVVRWTDPTFVLADGTAARPPTMTPSFPREGCPNTDVRATPDGLYQFTNRARTTRDWAVLSVPPNR